MPKLDYRANLSAAVFPFQIAEAGRTVIIPGADGNYDRRLDPQGEQKNAGVPQTLFLENVIPTAYGYQSVGYKSVGTVPVDLLPGLPATIQSWLYVDVSIGGPANTTRVLVLFRSNGSGDYEAIWTPLTEGLNITFNFATGDIPEVDHHYVSAAKVRGVQYVFDGIKLYTCGMDVDFTDISGTVTGIVVTDITNICSCANYLVCSLNDGSIAWSSTTTPTDFTPSLVSGAGSEVPQDVKGTIKFLKPAVNGFYIYTETEVVYAAYTGNSRYPFKFRAIPQSGGYLFQSHVHGNSDSPANLGLDRTYKLRQITPDGAAVIAEELSTHFERQGTVDLFDRSTNSFGSGTYTSDYSVSNDPGRVQVILDRYVIVSRPVDGTTYIHWVYDTVLRRYGKFVLPGRLYTNSREVFFWGDAINSTCYRLTFDHNDTSYTFDGVYALGKVQYVRSRKICLEGIEIEGAQDSATPNFSVRVLPSLDGRNFDAAVTPYEAEVDGDLRKYNLHNTAQNHTIVCKGAFNLSTMQLSLRTVGS